MKMTFAELKKSAYKVSSIEVGEFGYLFWTLFGVRYMRKVLTTLGKYGYLEKYSQSVSARSLAKVLFWVARSRMFERGSEKSPEKFDEYISKAHNKYNERPELGKVSVRWENSSVPSHERLVLKGSNLAYCEEPCKDDIYFEIIDLITDIIKNNAEGISFISISDLGNLQISYDNGDTKLVNHKSNATCLTSFASIIYSHKVLTEAISIVKPV